MSAARDRLFDLAPAPSRPVAPPSPAPVVARRSTDRDAWARVLATLPIPAARGLQVCAVCLRPIGRDEAAQALAVGSAHNPFEATRVDAENIVFHTPCHEAWWRDLSARAWAIVRQEETRHGGD